MPETKFWVPNKGNNNSKPFAFNTSFVSDLKKKISPKLVTTLSVFVGIFTALVLVIGLIFYIKIYSPAKAVAGKIALIRTDVKNAQNDVVGKDLVSLEKDLNKTEEDLKALRQSRDVNFGWAKNYKYVRDYYTDTDHFINAGFSAIEAVRQAIIAVKPFADAAGLKITESQEAAKQVSLLEAFSTWISVMPKVADDLDGVIKPLENVGKELSYVNPNRYPETFKGFPLRATIEKPQRILSQISNYTPDLKKALQVIPGLLGVATSEKRYMIIMQNDKEIRATGGFWTNYATFKVRNGLLDSDFTSKDMYSVDQALLPIDAYYTFPKAPASYEKYLKVVHLYARDANVSPDFPTAIDQFMVFYKLGLRYAPFDIKPVDGIFAIDTTVVKEFLDIAGPATIDGVTYDSGNVVLELEKIASLELKEQAGRKRVLGNLMHRMLVNVFESDKNLWPKLIEKGIDLVIRKHILVYNFDLEAQALLEKYNLAGRIVDPIEGDYSYVVSTNLGGDKTNWFVTKKVDHTIAKENDKWVHTVKLTYKYIQPSDSFAPFVKRFRDWVRVYAPVGSEIISVDGTEDGTATDQERNKTYFTGYLELGPDETKILTFKYYLPSSVMKDSGMYSLYVEKQPGTDGDQYGVTVNGKTETFSPKTDYIYKAKL